MAEKDGVHKTNGGLNSEIVSVNAIGVMEIGIICEESKVL